MSQSALTNIGCLVALPPGPTMDSRVVAGSQIENAAILWGSGGTIEWLGPQSELPIKPVNCFDAGGGLVTPGLVDCHTHLVFGGNRIDECALKCNGATYAEIRAAGGGITSTMRATRSATRTELFESAKIHAERLISGGVTSMEIKSGYGLDLENELKMLRVAQDIAEAFSMVVSKTLLALHTVPPEYEGNQPGYVEHVVSEILPEVARLGLAEAVDIFVEEGYFSILEAKRLFDTARELGLRTRMHVDQFSPHNWAVHAMRALGADTVDHLETTDANAISSVQNPQAIPVLLPASVMGLFQNRYPEARAMIEAGWNVALATDFNPGSSPCPSLLFVGTLASRCMRMQPAEILLAMTVNAAAAMGQGHQVGALQVGRRADCVVWNCKTVDELYYWMGAPLAQQVFIAGQPALS